MEDHHSRSVISQELTPDRMVPDSAQGNMVRDQPKLAEYATYESRLNTFQHWTFAYSSYLLASAGFLYSEMNRIICHYCCLVINAADVPKKNIYALHHEDMPHCWFLRQQLQKISFPDDILMTYSDATLNGSGRPVHEEYSSWERRRCSFPTDFPYVFGVQHLAEAGLFYTGNAFNAKCFQCGITLVVEGHNQSIYMEHLKCKPDCPYLQLKLKSTVQLPFADPPVIVTKSPANILLEARKCKVCGESPIKYLFVPCYEIVACSECARMLSCCPLCGERIKARLQVNL